MANKSLTPEVGKKYLNHNFHIVAVLKIEGDVVTIKNFHDNCTVRTSLKYLTLKEEVEKTSGSSNIIVKKYKEKV